MIRIGLGALAHANWHSQYVSAENDCWSELSVLQAAHAAELLIKARIAQEHPLLIFEHIPKSSTENGALLTYERLVSDGRTHQFRDLPDRLWATTGIRLPDTEKYQAFGRLRNVIQHFSPPATSDLSQMTLEFIFGVIDPFIHSCWGLYAIDYNEDHEPYTYFVPGIIARGITFQVSPESMKGREYFDISWPSDLRYAAEMQARMDAATLKDFDDGQIRV
jgi:hypothetical protein